MTKALKIALLLENLLYWNGGNKYVLELGWRLKRKCEVDVFVTKASVECREIFGDAGLKVIEFSGVGADNLRYTLFYPYYVLANARKLKRLLMPYDIVLSVNADFIASRLNKKTIYMCLEPNPWLYSSSFVKGRPIIQRVIANLGQPFGRLYDRRIKKRGDCLIAIDKFNESRLEKIYGRSSTIVYCGIDSTFFSKKRNAELEKAYSDYEVIIHSSSNLSPAKGTRILVEALAKIVDQVPNCRLLILNPHKNEIERMELTRLAQGLGVASNIEFLPPIKEEDLPSYYSLAKVVVQPSIYPAGAHMPLIEGAACEVPGITFEGTTNEEDVIDGETGFLVSYGDIEALAQRTVEIIQNPQLFRDMGKKARGMVTTVFSWDRNTDVLWELIQEVKDK